MVTATHSLELAIRYLAGQCDGALTLDGVGFNGTDSKFGKWLAEIPEAAWTPADRRKAWVVLRKYRGQLERAGISYERLPVPPSADLVDDGIIAGIHLGNSFFQIVFRYDPDAVAFVRQIPGARWYPATKNWSAAVTAASARFILDNAARFSIAPDARAAAEQALSPTASAPVVEVERVVRWHKTGGYLAFEFPFDYAVKDEVKALGARFNLFNDKLWTADITYLTEVPQRAERFFARLRALATERGFRIDEPVIAWMAAEEERVAVAAAQRAALRAAAAERIALSSAVAGPAVDGFDALYGYQRAGVHYAATLPQVRWLCGDEPGLGKTLQALALLALLRAQGRLRGPVVVVCPANLKANWLDEIAKWVPEARAVKLDGAKNIVITDRERRALPALQGADFIVLNYDIAVHHVETLRALGPGAVVIDESHYIKEPKSQRSKALLRLVEGVDVRIALSGTPVLNRPKELANQLDWLGLLGEFGGWYKFVARYCAAERTRFGLNTSGASNLKELNERLRALCYTHHKKLEVLTQLPPKRRVYITTDLTNRAQYVKAEDDLRDYLREKVAANIDDVDVSALSAWEVEELIESETAAALNRAAGAQHLVKIAALRQLAARGKVAAAVEWVDDFLDSDEKLVVFAAHRDIQQALVDAFKRKGVGLVTILGGDSNDKRDDAKKAFQSDPGVRLLIGSLKAAREGITLTAASNVLFIEQGWTPGEQEQAEDRVHRIGQEADSVTAWYLIGAQSIDEIMRDLIDAKRGVVRETATGDAQDGIERSDIVKGIINRLLAA